MEYVTSIERYGFKKGLEEGLKKGRKKGRQEGRQEGREQARCEGLVEGIAVALDAKFGPAGAKLLRKVQALNSVAELSEFVQFLKTATAIDNVREYFK